MATNLKKLLKLQFVNNNHLNLDKKRKDPRPALGFL